MQNEGKKFEDCFKKSVPSDCYYQRIKDPPHSFKKNEALRFALKNPYDCFIFCYPNFFTLELKSTKATSMTFWREDYEDEKKDQTFMIKKHQIKELLISSKFEGIASGLILNWRKTNHTYFWDIDSFVSYTNTLNKKSFNEQDVIKNGGILIEQTLMRTNYKYNVKGFIEKMKTN